MDLASRRRYNDFERTLPVKKQISITADDPILNTLEFRPFQSIVERGVTPFVPRAHEKQTVDILTPWGETLTATAGDLIVYEIKTPDDRWPVNAEIFDATYVITQPGRCIKRGNTFLIPLTELTGGDEEVEVIVHSLEGKYSVRAGDFYLARGIKGEIWAMPKEKVETNLALVEE